MVFPLWKSLHSLNLMLPKEDRKALLLRLFNDDTPLVNISHRNASGDAPRQEVAVDAEADLEKEEAEHTRRNSSSGEDDESEGGVLIDI
jgi:multisite-specific tRNA:(cytosine-C5)-methyltransferase